MEYYTYAYLREDGTPYYIGKGEKDRIYKKGKGEIRPPKDKSRVIFLKQNLTEEESFKHEVYMIAVFGRKDLGTGILRNRTNGGEGFSGAIHTSETKAKISAAMKGENSPNYGKTLSPEIKAKLSAAMKGKTLSPETRAKISAAMEGENSPNYGKMWITNGEISKFIPIDEDIPIGYSRGMTKKSRKKFNDTIPSLY
jgi:hypothetical protein